MCGNPLDSIMAKSCAWRSLAPRRMENTAGERKSLEEKGEQRGGRGQRFCPAWDAPSPPKTHMPKGPRAGGPVARMVFLGGEKQSWEVKVGESEPSL